ncbi:MAG: L,D-transpeptidase family protein [Synergistaceae bacterium]|jgi:D-alanyl-D-alanine dipeptidase/L,D-peptidoglycan transpeptidase YkuD (ErfK/YbiS/YcfS/YnhG family)|nr:L,D-transpeptidase family protein [Synergistaceae bacterium]
MNLLIIPILALALTLLIMEAAWACEGRFIAVTDVIPDAVLDIRYAGENNFVGEPIDGYRAPVAILSLEAALSLRNAADSLRRQGYAIKIFDAYRPASAVAHFVRWGRDLSDLRKKSLFYPDTDKSLLFKKGYIATRSGHSRGGTVDLTIVRTATGEEVDMGSPFDYFGDISHMSSPLVSGAQAENRKILKSAMERAGFKALRTEWWHFTMKNEPYKNTHFDFPVDYPQASDGAAASELDRVSGGAAKIMTAFPASGQNATDKTAAIIRVYEKTEIGWILKFETKGFFGKSGVRDDKREGDGATPSGVYSFGRAFGVAEDPGARAPYTRASDGDVWVDDPNSRFYNTWQSDNNPDKDWKSAERITKYPEQYKYAIAINYNSENPIPGRGSAIFLHCSTGGPTAGCVSVPEADMIYLLSFIDGGTKIFIKN